MEHPLNDFAILSPYLVPSSRPHKTVNVGDGFILRAIERRLGSFRPSRIFSSREPPSSAVMNELRDARIVILGGANQLSDTFSVWPGATAHDVRSRGVAFVPFGIGLSGLPEKNRGFSDNTREVIEGIHERIEFSSWRCGRTVALLENAFPKLKGRCLTTSCPVVFDEPLLNGSRFNDRESSVAVTVTDRDRFWDRESSVLRFVARQFPYADKTLILHQDFDPVTPFESRYGTWPGVQFVLSKRARLRSLARKLGYRVIVPSSADACIALYEDIDFHIGSRLHAHLLFLSRNKRSFLVAVDERARGFAELLQCPLVDHRDVGRQLDFDFEIVRENVRRVFETMQTFVSSLGRK